MAESFFASLVVAQKTPLNGTKLEAAETKSLWDSLLGGQPGRF
jgi:hypothetical protein